MIKPYNVLLVDDHQIVIYTFRNALRLVEKELGNVEFHIDEATSYETALKKINKKPADLVFLDIRLPCKIKNMPYPGEDLGVIITKQSPEAKIIVCTSISDNFRLYNIVRTINPNGLLIKSDTTFDDLIGVIKNAVRC